MDSDIIALGGLALVAIGFCWLLDWWSTGREP